jgi:hypothetical protein
MLDWVPFRVFALSRFRDPYRLWDQDHIAEKIAKGRKSENAKRKG